MQRITDTTASSLAPYRHSFATTPTHTRTFDRLHLRSSCTVLASPITTSPPSRTLGRADKQPKFTLWRMGMLPCGSSSSSSSYNLCLLYITPYYPSTVPFPYAIPSIHCSLLRLTHSPPQESHKSLANHCSAGP